MTPTAAHAGRTRRAPDRACGRPRSPRRRRRLRHGPVDPGLGRSATVVGIEPNDASPWAELVTGTENVRYHAGSSYATGSTTAARTFSRARSRCSGCSPSRRLLRSDAFLRLGRRARRLPVREPADALAGSPRRLRGSARRVSVLNTDPRPARKGALAGVARGSAAGGAVPGLPRALPPLRRRGRCRSPRRVRAPAGSTTTLLVRGYSEDDLGLGLLRDAAARQLAEPAPWWPSYRVIVALK